MTRQRALKRRIRARMAKTGERYSTARRQVLRRLGTVADQSKAPEPSTRHRRFRIGAAALLLAAGVAGAVIVVMQPGEEPAVQGPSARAEPTLPPGVEVRYVGEGPEECNIQGHEPLPAKERPEEIVCFETDLNGVSPGDISTEAVMNATCDAIARLGPEHAANVSACRRLALR